MLKTTIVAVLLALSVPSSQSEDNVGQAKFVQASKHFYVSTETRSFLGAWMECKTGGLHLAIVDSEDEQTELSQAINSTKYNSGEGYWIGAASEMYSSDSWYWVDSGVRMIYSNWGTNQPKYYKSDEEYYYDTDYCVRIGNFYKVNEPDMWANIDCTRDLYYICETSF